MQYDGASGAAKPSLAGAAGSRSSQLAISGALEIARRRPEFGKRGSASAASLRRAPQRPPLRRSREVGTMKIRLQKTDGLLTNTAEIARRIEATAAAEIGRLLGERAAASSVLHVALARNRNDGWTASMQMHLPGRKIVAVHGRGADIEAAAKDGARKVAREVKRHFAKLHAQDQFKRKARRERLRALKASVAALPEAERREAEQTLGAMVDRLRKLVERELAYLRAVGDLPAEYPTVDDVVDEALVATTAAWKPGGSSEQAWQALLRNAFRVIDEELAASRQYGETVSLDAPVPADALDQAESMVEEALYEYYQPDDAVTLADVLADESVDVAATVESALDRSRTERASSRAFAWQLLRDLPTAWRRTFLLAKVEGMNAAAIAAVLDVEERTAAGWIEQARAFLAARLRDAGVGAEQVESFLAVPDAGE
jgi:DNA-directed RNA polymerase specialized sigma24 family protein